MSKSELDLSLVWVPDEDRTNCICCSKRFYTFRRRHHCRACGEVVCRKCSVARLYMRNQQEPVRVCRTCCPEYGTVKGVLVPHQVENIPKKINMPLRVQPKIKRMVSSNSPTTASSTSITYKSLFVFVGLACAQYALPIRALFVLSILKAVAFFIIKKNYRVQFKPSLRLESNTNHQVSTEVKDKNVPNALTTYQSKCEKSALNYIQALESAHEKALGEFSFKDGEDGWRFHGRQQNVDIYLKKEGHLTFVKGEGVIPVKKELITDLLNDPDRIAEYDPQLKHVELLELLDSKLLTIEGDAPLISVCYSQCYRVFPTTARDACVVRARIAKNDGKIVTIATSVQHPKAPLRNDYVRVNLQCSASILEDYGENNEHTFMKYLVMLDPTGNIPTFVADKVAPERALLIHRVRKCFQ